MKNSNSADLAVDDLFIQWVKYPTRESNAYWENWLRENPDQEAMVAEARELVMLLSQDEGNAHDHELDAIWLKLTEARKNAANHPSDHGTVIPIKFWQQRSLWAAAAIGLILLVSAIAFLRPQHTPYIKYATGFGEMRTIQLPDKSVIVLNSNSIVTIPEEWSTNEPRRVKLEGEAFFSVSHQASGQKFIVTTNSGRQIDVLGTEFNVFDRDNESRVVLASGKVSLSLEERGHKRQLEMQPGDLVSVTADAGITHKQVDPSLYTGWMNHKVYFDDFTLRDVASMLEQQYGYHVVFGSKALSDQKMTAFLEVRSPDDIISTISETFDVTITQKEKTIIISSL
jgi:transmembrane sensor